MRMKLKFKHNAMRKLFVVLLSLCLAPALLAQNNPSKEDTEKEELRKENALLKDSLKKTNLLLIQAMDELNQYKAQPTIAESENVDVRDPLSKVKKDVDEASGITWYENSYFVHYHNSNNLSIYIGQKGKKVALRLLISYQGKDWLFFDHAYLAYDDQTMEIPFDVYKEKKTDSKDLVWGMG